MRLLSCLYSIQSSLSLIPPVRNSFATRGRRSRRFASVSGTVYDGAPLVTLFTKEGCTLCDKVKNVLHSIREQQPHGLQQIDITDPDQTDYWKKYKYDIPVLHVNGKYWIKHRITEQEALKGLQQVQQGTFESPPGEPNATAMER